MDISFFLCCAYPTYKSYPTLFNFLDCRPPGSSVHGDSPGKNTGVGCQALLHGLFPTQGLNPGLPHCRQTLYRLSHQGSPRTRVGILSLFQEIFLTQEIIPESPALQADSLSAEVAGKPLHFCCCC